MKLHKRDGARKRGGKERRNREEELKPFKPNHLEDKPTPGFGM